MDSRHESLREWGEKIKVQCSVKPKQKLYRSKHDPDPSLVEASTFPQQSKPKCNRSQGGLERKKRVYRKPAVPKRSDAPVRIGRTKKNFVMANAICNILDQPQRVERMDVNEPKPGSLGKLPKYLARVKAEIRGEKQALKDEIMLKEKREREAKGITIETPLDEEERKVLVEKLKTKWDETNHQYQRHSHIVNLDTVGKISRKKDLKERLEELERSIDRLRGSVTILKNFRTPSN